MEIEMGTVSLSGKISRVSVEWKPCNSSHEDGARLGVLIRYAFK
jgi:hypothetical protein